jgi:hypothetical protein
LTRFSLTAPDAVKVCPDTVQDNTPLILFSAPVSLRIQVA